LYSFIENEFKDNESTAIDNFQKAAFFVALELSFLNSFFLRKNFFLEEVIDSGRA
jgi:hypothetical protein